MSTSKNNNERESFQKSPILKAGEYDFWAQKFETHVRSIDGELQKIITTGDLLVTQNNGKPVPFGSFTAEDWTKNEKNNKALKLLTSRLDNSDRRTVLGSPSAKEKWDALAKIYQGSNDVKRDRISALLQDYDNFNMGEKETIEELQARFLTLINSLAYLGERIENWK